MQLKQVLIKAMQVLSDLDNARLESEVLLSAVLGKTRTWLKTHDDEVFTPEQVEIFHQYVKRRAQRVPVAYILGYKVWNDLKVLVDESTLIPRDETEVLAQKIVEANLEIKSESLNILDIGTGSGCISIFLKKHFSDSAVTALDISAEALKVAQKNAALHNTEVNFIQSDLLSEVSQKSHYDVIVANLPYVPASGSLAPEIYQEPRTAIFSGVDGLDLIRKLEKGLIEKEVSFNQLWLEFLPGQKTAIKEIFGHLKVEFLTDSGEDVFFAKIS